MTKQGVESTAGRPPAQAGPGEGEVGDEGVGGGEPGQQDLLLTPGLGTAVVPGYQAVHLEGSGLRVNEELRGDHSQPD